jgi:hypothetical protein
MATEWRLSLEFGGKTNCYVRTLSWDEYTHFKQTGELPKPGPVPSAESQPFGFYRDFAPPRRPLPHHERHWPGTSPGLNRFGFPTKRQFPTRRRLRLIVNNSK